MSESFFKKLFIKKKIDSSLSVLMSRCQRSDEKRKEAEEKFKKIFELSLDGILLVDIKKKKIISANKVLCHRLGYGLEEIKKSGLSKIYSLKNFFRLVNQLKYPTNDNTGLVYDQPIKKKNKSFFFADVHSSLIVVGDKELLMSVFHDVSEEKKVERRLLEDRVKDDVVLASIGDAVMACDHNGRIVLFNGVAETLTGYSAQEVIGHHYGKIIRFIREIDERPGNDFIAEAIKTGKKTRIANHTLLIRKDRHKIPVADSAAPIRDIDGQLIGCVVVFRDVAFERAIDKAKNEFISLAAHQLRTPLGSMRWNLELLQESEKSLSVVSQERLQDALASNIRVASLISDLSNIVRIEQGGIKPELSCFKINEIIHEATKEIKQEVEDDSLRLKVFLPPRLPEVYCDRGQFREVVQNLLSNAVKYNKKAGKITLQAQIKGRFLEVRISDSGIGIPAVDRQKVFSKFYRSCAAQKVDTDGNGLGLFIVRSFVEAWGGNIGFKSEKGRGTTFYFTVLIAEKIKK